MGYKGKNVRTVLAGILILLCLVITSCNDTWIGREEIVEDNTTQELVTREYLLEAYGITHEDLEGIELELIVDEDKLYTSQLEKYMAGDKEGVLNILRISQNWLDEERFLDENSKAYLFEAKEYTGEFPDIKTIKYLIYEFDSGAPDASESSHLIDFGNNILYFSGAETIARDYLWADAVEFTEKEKEIILNRIAQIGIDQWDYDYDKDAPSKYLTWKLGMEFEDGTIISKHGDFSDKGQPGNLEEFMLILRDVLFGRLE